VARPKSDNGIVVALALWARWLRPGDPVRSHHKLAKLIKPFDGRSEERVRKILANYAATIEDPLAAQRSPDLASAVARVVITHQLPVDPAKKWVCDLCGQTSEFNEVEGQLKWRAVLRAVMDGPDLERRYLRTPTNVMIERIERAIRGED